MTMEISETMGSGVGEQEGGGGLTEAFLENQERRRDALRRLDLIHHNYMIEIESLRERLKKVPGDVVRMRRLAVIEKILLPKLHEVIFHMEMAKS